MCLRTHSMHVTKQKSMNDRRRAFDEHENALNTNKSAARFIPFIIRTKVDCVYLREENDQNRFCFETLILDSLKGMVSSSHFN